MKDYAFLVLIVLIKALVSLTADDASSVISCNMELLTWQEAFDTCKSKGGYMLPFETGLGQTIDALHLQSDADIWTADHLTLVHGKDKYCGFNYLNSTFYETGEVFYGDCYAKRNYFCKNEIGVLDVYNSTRENVHCNYNVLYTDSHSIRSRIKPGYYWNKWTVHGTASTASIMVNNFNIQEILCGGYKSSIGRYYVNCTAKRFSFCTQNLGIRTTITQMTVREEIATDKTDTSTKHPMAGMTTSVEYKTKVYTQEDEQSSDLWIIIVIPLGVVLLLTFGITFIIYINRKRLQKRESIEQPTNISNLTTVSGQSDYETLHQQGDEHEYSSSRHVDEDRVAMNTYVNDVVNREEK